MSVKWLAVCFGVLLASAARADCINPDNNTTVDLGMSVCLSNGTEMRCEQLTQSTRGLIFQHRCPPPKLLPNATKPAALNPQPAPTPPAAEKPLAEPPPPYISPEEAKCATRTREVNTRKQARDARCLGRRLPIPVARNCDHELDEILQEQREIVRACKKFGFAIGK